MGSVQALPGQASVSADVLVALEEDGELDFGLE